MPKPLQLLLFGAGNRGADAYGVYALQHPDQVRFIAVAEPDPFRRTKFSQTHQIPPHNQFTTWEEALTAGKIADGVVNATQDDMHHSSTLAALKTGYDILLEKPIAPNLQDTLEIIKAAEDSGQLLMICHVLRYTDYFQKVSQILKSGLLGQIINISHSENVSYFHMAHSYVRGNWRNTDVSAPMILAKCCHDLDLLYWFLDEKPDLVSSVGNLRHFRSENAPSGAPERCTDGCPAAGTCPYFAPRVYLDNTPIKHAVTKSDNPVFRFAGNLSLKQPKLARALGKIVPAIRPLTEYSGWPRSTITQHPESNSAVLEALRTGPYGRCVYRCDNTVVDHQIVSLRFNSGITATLTMHGHSHEEGRTLRIDGSHATLLGKFGYSQAWIEVHHHASFQRERFKFPTVIENSSGHGGGDTGLMHRFVTAMQGEKPPLTGARDSLESHLMAFAAEEARLENKVIRMKDFREKVGVSDEP